MTNKPFTKGERKLFIFVIIVYFSILFTNSLTKIYSKNRVVHCGSVVKKYQISAQKSGYLNMLELKINNVQQSFLVSPNLFKKIFFDNHKNIENIFDVVQNNDNVCVVYSPKYKESTFFINEFRRDSELLKTPYLYDVYFEKP